MLSFLAPLSHPVGRSFNIFSNVMILCFCIRVSSDSDSGCSSDFLGRPFFFGVFFFVHSGIAFFWGFSLASIAVESHELCKSTSPENISSINALCARYGRSVSTKSAKALEKVASLGDLCNTFSSANAPYIFVRLQPLLGEML